MKLMIKVAALILAPLSANAQVAYVSTGQPTQQTSQANQVESKPLVEASMEEMGFKAEEKILIRGLMSGEIAPSELTSNQVEFIKASPKEFRRLVLSSVKSGDPCGT